MKLNLKSRRSQIFALIAATVSVWLFVLYFYLVHNFVPSWFYRGKFQTANLCSITYIRPHLELCAMSQKNAEAQEKILAIVDEEDQRLAAQFPAGTDLSIFKTKMQDAGGREVIYSTTPESEEVILFEIVLTKLGVVFISAEHDKTGKLVSPPKLFLGID